MIQTHDHRATTGSRCRWRRGSCWTAHTPPLPSAGRCAYIPQQLPISWGLLRLEREVVFLIVVKVSIQHTVCNANRSTDVRMVGIVADIGGHIDTALMAGLRGGGVGRSWHRRDALRKRARRPGQPPRGQEVQAVRRGATCTHPCANAPLSRRRGAALLVHGRSVACSGALAPRNVA